MVAVTLSRLSRLGAMWSEGAAGPLWQPATP
jgi:hypothetical protein